MTGLARLGTLLLAIIISESPIGAAPAMDLSRSLLRARELAFSRRFDEAVVLYDEVLRAAPDRWDAALGRAEALSWGGRYALAEMAYRALLTHRPDSLDALRGLARTAYWSGDFRRALKLFARLKASAPADPEVREAMGKLEALMRPVATLGLTAAHDDQPADLSAFSSKVTWGLDPLTTAAAEIGGLQLDAQDAGGFVRLGDARIGISARYPRAALNVAGRVGLRRFSDGASAPLFDLRLERPFAAFSLSAALVRDTALDSAPSYRSHITVESLALGVRREEMGAHPTGAKLTGAVEVRVVRFGDSNAALSASAWAALPLGRLGPLRLAGTAASSYRDTRDARVRAVLVGSSPIPTGGTAYEIRTLFDPYVTPERQLEARLGLHAVLPATPRLTLAFTAEAGAGRERATGFGPASGPAAGPIALTPGTYVRHYTPFRAAFSATLVSGSKTLQADVSQASSAFYNVTTVDLRVTRRF